MDDLISRQAAIDEIDEWIKAFLENGHKESAADACLIQDGIIQLPSVQPEIEERMSETEQNVPNDDLISRKAAIDAIEAVFPVDPMKSEYAQGIACGAALSKTYIEQLPSAQPDDRLAKIADLVEGTIDHFDLDDAMDLFYQIKEVLK